jgi:lambda family phage portal protein
MNWIERSLAAVAPHWHLRRLRARMAADLTARHYEAAAAGRRTQGWNRSIADPNQASAGALGSLRAAARDLVRNNPYAEAAVSTIVDHTIGWGITSSEESDVWRRWAESTDCDADGRLDFAGLQKLVLRTVAESGECLVRGRVRRPEDNLPIPLQLQILEPDYLDSLKDVDRLPNGGRIIQGVEFDAIGRRVAFWLFREHPGSNSTLGTLSSERVPAERIRQVFKTQRPGQVRGVTWFAPVLLTFKDFDDLEDATLMKQKVAACLSVLTTDIDGSATPLGEVRDAATPLIDTLSPGSILNVATGRDVHVVQPPTVGEYPDYARTQQRKIATGLGISYEDLTGDYTNTNFSAGRMSRLRHEAHVQGWQWDLLVPQFLDPVWGWAREAAGVMGQTLPDTVEWNMPPLPMIDPDKEGLAAQRNIRTGIQSLFQVIRERGYNPNTYLKEVKASFDKLDELGLVLDCDPRKMSQFGQPTNGTQGTPPKTEEDDDERAARLRSALRALR